MDSIAPSGELVRRFGSDLTALTNGTQTLAVAVSGGPDSLALLLLANAALPERIQAATVNHGLRPEAAEEARFVASLCARLHVPHTILDAVVDTRGASLQQAAREARYQVLAHWLEENRIEWLATAHHLDDQAETLLMRLLRGSGVAGLAGVRPSGPLPSGGNARLVRPLLGWRRSELRALVEAAGIDPVLDPSNEDDRFDRVRLRRHLAAAEWIEPVSLARSAAAVREADEALAWTMEEYWIHRVSRDDAFLTFSPEFLPPEIVRRMLMKIFASFAAAPMPRGEEVQRLAATLAAGGSATLGGLKCSGGPVWSFEPEGPRKGR